MNKLKDLLHMILCCVIGALAWIGIFIGLTIVVLIEILIFNFIMNFVVFKYVIYILWGIIIFILIYAMGMCILDKIKEYKNN